MSARYGDIINSARELAADGKTDAEIRAALKAVHKPPAVSRAITRLRLQGALPPREKRRPNRFVIQIRSSCAEKITAAAVSEGILPSQMARVLLERASTALTGLA